MRIATHNRIRPDGPASTRRTLRIGGFVLAAIALAVPIAYGGVNRWTSGGPAEPSRLAVTSLAIDPVDPNTVYAGTGVEVFKSNDGGLSWTAAISDRLDGSGFRSGLAIHPLLTSHVYATTQRGVFKSIDAGVTWTAAGPPVNVSAYSVAIDPANPSTILAGTADGLFKSTDSGASWSGKLLASSIYGLVFSPRTPSTIFATDIVNDDYGDYDYSPPPASTIYRSTDAGAHWSSDNAGFVINPGALAVDPTNPSTVYVGGVLGIYKSVDSGSIWRLVSTNLGSSFITALVIDPRNPATLYATDYDKSGVLQSSDGGVTWREFNNGLTNRSVKTLAIDRTGTRLHAGTFNGGVFDYQIFSGAQDLSVGTDNKTRVLFTDLDNRAAVRSFDKSAGSAGNGPHGPYNGWYARAAADGSDGLTRVLWNNLDGSAALWLLGPAGNQASYRYGPSADWTAVDVAVGGDGTTHLLWTNIDGRAELTSVAVAGAVVRTTTYGPFPGWAARAIANGPDGLTRLLWSNTDGRVGLSLIDAGRIAATYRLAPAPGWTARDVAVSTDNQARILFVNADGRIAVWSVDNSGAVSPGTVYEPRTSGQTATRISAGTDGLTRVLWTGPENTGSLWLMGLDNALQTTLSFCGGLGESSGCGEWDY